MKEDYIRKSLIFHGRVQGVGFRYYACNAAKSLGATGWVCNLYDGTVECEIQGTYNMIEKFIDMLQSARYIRIDYIEEKEIELREESCFKVKHY